MEYSILPQNPAFPKTELRNSKSKTANHKENNQNLPKMEQNYN